MIQERHTDKEIDQTPIGGGVFRALFRENYDKYRRDIVKYRQGTESLSHDEAVFLDDCFQKIKLAYDLETGLPYNSIMQPIPADRLEGFRETIQRFDEEADVLLMD